MLVLTIRTDKPKSEIGLYDESHQVAYEIWEAHRELSETIHKKIDEILSSQNYSISDINGLIVYKGPGSFTGLRIGISVANSLAYSLQVPIVAESGQWIEEGLKKLKASKTDKIAIPEYGSVAHITQQKK